MRIKASYQGSYPVRIPFGNTKKPLAYFILGHIRHGSIDFIQLALKFSVSFLCYLNFVLKSKVSVILKSNKETSVNNKSLEKLTLFMTTE